MVHGATEAAQNCLSGLDCHIPCRHLACGTGRTVAAHRIVLFSACNFHRPACVHSGQAVVFLDDAWLQIEFLLCYGLPEMSCKTVGEYTPANPG
jgi:hypothetical protein